MTETGTYRQVRFERPEGSAQIFLVRHGESALADIAHPFPMTDGRGDPPLSSLGRSQAEALATRFADIDLDAIYVTQLRRTAETAAPLARLAGLEPVVERGLIEVSMGEWEGGLYRKRMAEQHPLALQAFSEQRFDVIPGAESNHSLSARTGSALAGIAERHPDGRLVVVAHAVVISSLLAQATGSEPFAFLGIDNASISEIVASSGRWHLRRFNDTAHLEHLGDPGPT